jgi:hypothetical protein
MWQTMLQIDAKKKKKNYTASIYFMISNDDNKFANSHTDVTRSTEESASELLSV